jgi:hypothetical protein
LIEVGSDCIPAHIYVSPVGKDTNLGTSPDGWNHYAYYTSSSTSWQYVSDRNSKRDFARVETTDVLRKLASLPMSTWTFKSDSTRTRHMGPMAQDFHAAFGLGESDRSIDTGDIIGVSLAAIQGLHREVGDLKISQAAAEKEREKLERENIDLSQRVKRLEETVTRLATARTEPQISGVVGTWLGIVGFAGAAAMVVARRRRGLEVM